MEASAAKRTKAPPAASTRPFARFEWMIAGRYLRSRRKEAFISVIAGFSFVGIALGVATLIIVMSVMNGFRAELLGKILGVTGHIIVQPIETPLTDYDAVAQRLEGVDGVRLAMPFIERHSAASRPQGELSFALVRGVREGDLDRLGLVADNIRAGTLEGFDESGGIAIGSLLAQQLGVGVGDRVQIFNPSGAVTVAGTTARNNPFEVVAIFEIGMAEYDQTFVFMPLSTAQPYFNMQGQVSAIDVYVDDPDNLGATTAHVLGAAERPVAVTDWRQNNVTFFSALEVERNVMFLILTLIILVAALNIVSGLTMLVKDKGRDIAILRTMGATRGAVLRIFFITGASIGVFGTIAGLILGVIVTDNVESIRQFISKITGTELFSPEVYFLSALPAKMEVGETVTIVLIALALSFVATLYPAWRAARLDPVAALRYQ